MRAAAHFVSPPSFGIFQCGIVQSYPFTLVTKSRADALLVGQQVTTNLNCTFDLACLRTKTIAEIVAASDVGRVAKDQVVGDMLTWGPTMDGYNQLTSPLVAFQNGDAVDVPLVIGTNADELTFFQDLYNVLLHLLSIVVGRDISIDLYELGYRLSVNEVWNDRAADVLALYPPLPNLASNYDQFMPWSVGMRTQSGAFCAPGVRPVDARLRLRWGSRSTSSTCQ